MLYSSGSYLNEFIDSKFFSILLCCTLSLTVENKQGQTLLLLLQAGCMNDLVAHVLGWMYKRQMDIHLLYHLPQNLSSSLNRKKKRRGIKVYQYCCYDTV